ncbi:MAG: nucleoside triphosphate pyrophosphohydrolase [Methylococcaceae bacterium]
MNNTLALLDIMARLRHPETGCAWDLRQDFASLAPYTLEEAYEVTDAIERDNMADLKEELGDLLLQVVFHARMAEEKGLFEFEDVAAAIGDKLIRRHPHVFADIEFATDEDRQRFWEAAKEEERREKAGSNPPDSVLHGMAHNQPALMLAQKLQERAARNGFDWPDVAPVFAKVREELDELEQACREGDQAHIIEEAGDLLFVTVCLARHLDVDAESALRKGNQKFTRRFQHIERRLAQEGKSLKDSHLAEMDTFWNEAKKQGL